MEEEGTDKISFSGYETLMEGQAFTRRSEWADAPSKEFSDLILLSKFRAPTNEEVLENLKEQCTLALELNLGPLDDMQVFLQNNCTEKFLIDVATGGRDSKEILPKFIPNTHFEGGHYIQLLKGPASDPRIRKALSAQENERKDYLRKSLIQGNTDVLDLLLEEGRLPTRDYIDRVLEMRVMISGVLITNRPTRQYQFVEEMVNQVFEGLDDPRKIRMIPDESQKKLREYSVVTLQNLGAYNRRVVEEILQDRIERERTVSEIPIVGPGSHRMDN